VFGAVIAAEPEFQKLSFWLDAAEKTNPKYTWAPEPCTAIPSCEVDLGSTHADTVTDELIRRIDGDPMVT
jgi:hypothetical protein